MTKHRIAVWLVTLALIVGVAACGQSTTPVSPSDAVSAPSESPIATPSVAPGLSGSPTPTEPVATPTPRPRLARWSTEAHRIFSDYCDSPVATVDGDGRFHVAVECSRQIRYAFSTDGKEWTASTLPTPTDRSEIDPQLAVDGRTLYMAFTRLRPIDPDTCGGPRSPIGAVGVYYRKRTLPNGKWSAPVRIGRTGERIQSLRVADGVIHWTFLANDNAGPVSYASLDGSKFREIRLGNAVATSVRIGDDGLARIAYTSAHSVTYAIVSAAGRLSTTTIFSADDVLMDSPVLVLGSGDRAFLSWAAARGSDEAGCAESPVPTHQGTWFATDVDGKWATKRLTKDVGSASLALDVTSGRLHAIYNDERGVRYVTRASDGTWSGSRLDVTADFSGTVLRRDPRTGLLLLVGSVLGDDESKNGMFAVTAS